MARVELFSEGGDSERLRRVLGRMSVVIEEGAGAVEYEMLDRGHGASTTTTIRQELTLCYYGSTVIEFITRYCSNGGVTQWACQSIGDVCNSD